MESKKKKLPKKKVNNFLGIKDTKIFNYTGGDFIITVYYNSDTEHYSVLYGEQLQTGLTYGAAAHELGKCLLLDCEDE